MGIRIAEARGIPVPNLGTMTPRAVCELLSNNDPEFSSA